METSKAVYKCICAVMLALSRDGVAKDRKNAAQGFNFRGIDDIYNALAPTLAKTGLAILPRVLSRTMEPQQSKSGGTLSYVTVEVEYDLVAAEDGSMHTVRTFGEAMDTGDKATNKAMSAAYKYMAFQTFCIPTEGDNDADASTPAPAPRTASPASPRPAPAPSAAPSQTPAPASGGDALDMFLAKAGIPMASLVAWCTANKKPDPTKAGQEMRGKMAAFLSSSAAAEHVAAMKSAA